MTHEFDPNSNMRSLAPLGSHLHAHDLSRLAKKCKPTPLAKSQEKRNEKSIAKICRSKEGHQSTKINQMMGRI